MYCRSPVQVLTTILGFKKGDSIHRRPSNINRKSYPFQHPSFAITNPPSSIYIYTSFQPSAKRTRIPMAFKIRFSPQDEVSPQGTWKSSICRAKNDPCDQQHSKMNLRERAQRWSTAQIKSGISEDALGILADLPRMGHEP